MLQKVRKQGIRFWDERTFWHEIIYKSLIPTFGFYKLSHARIFSHSKILFLVSLLFVALLNSIPTYLLNFEFFIILYSVLVNFMHTRNYRDNCDNKQHYRDGKISIIAQP